MDNLVKSYFGLSGWVALNARFQFVLSSCPHGAAYIDLGPLTNMSIIVSVGLVNANDSPTLGLP